MRLLRNLLLLLLLVVGGYYFLEQNNISPEEAIDDFSKVLKQKKNMLETKEVPEKKKESIPLEGDFFQWAGKTSDELAKELGKQQLTYHNHSDDELDRVFYHLFFMLLG